MIYIKKKSTTISSFDVEALKVIRENVINFLNDSLKRYDKEGLLLKIGPQNYGGAKNFKKITVQTLDIEKNANTTYIGDISKQNEFLKDNSFDIIVCTEVLEHVLNPFDAINEIYRILKKKGILLMSVPFNFRIHGPLPDCWRFTEYGLRELLKKFEIKEINQIETKNRNLMPIHYTIVAIK